MIKDLERARRIQAVQQEMIKADLDVLLLFTGPNLTYFASAPGAGGRSAARPFVLAIPRAGDPVLLVHQGREFEARRFSNIGDVRSYSGLSRVPANEIVAILRGFSCQTGTIGLEYGREMVIDLPHTEVNTLQAALSEYSLRDASHVLWSLRMIKSPAEVAAIEKACSITADAFAETFGAVRPGMKELEIQHIFFRSIRDHGGSSPWAIVTSGEGNYDLATNAPGPRPVETGEMVWVDGGCAINGYFSDYSRACVVGKAPSQRQAEAQAIVQDLTQATVAEIRPGIAVGDLARSCNSRLRRVALDFTSVISNLAGRIGHGMGMAVTEPPSICEAGDDTVLQPGMVITIEPGFATRYGTFHVEANVVVTESGARTLSNAPWQLDGW